MKFKHTNIWKKKQKKYISYVDYIQGASLDPPGDVDGGGDQSDGGVQIRRDNLNLSLGNVKSWQQGRGVRR